MQNVMRVHGRHNNTNNNADRTANENTQTGGGSSPSSPVVSGSRIDSYIKNSYLMQKQVADAGASPMSQYQVYSPQSNRNHFDINDSLVKQTIVASKIKEKKEKLQVHISEKIREKQVDANEKVVKIKQKNVKIEYNDSLKQHEDPNILELNSKRKPIF